MASRPPVLPTPASARPPVAAPPQRRLPPLRTVLPDAGLDADYLRLPVGPGAIHAYRYGHGGPPVLLLHGFTTHAPLWRRVAPLLLARGCMVIVPDLLGFGESDRPPGGPYTIAAQARHLDRALALLRVPRVLAVGQDLGGRIVRRLAAMRPERVAGLVLLAPGAPIDEPEPEIVAVQQQTGPALLEISSRPLGVVDLLLPALREAVHEGSSIDATRFARYAAPYTGPLGARHLLDLARAITEDADVSVAPPLAVPVTIVLGEHDPLPAPVASADVVRLSGAKRLLAEEAPAALADVLLARTMQAFSAVSLPDALRIG
ncbi:MAG: alpha/beta hydrolase [Gemmatimonadaceae bacterium]|nr:alpha/beta hydrolase [Gemmatimonadaceae bacterium]